MHLSSILSTTALLLATGSLASYGNTNSAPDSNDAAGFTLYNSRDSCKGTGTPASASAKSKYCYNIPGHAGSGKIIWPKGTWANSYQAVFYSQPGCPDSAREDRLHTKKLDGRHNGVCLKNEWCGEEWVKGVRRADASVWIAPVEAGAPGNWPVRN